MEPLAQGMVGDERAGLGHDGLVVPQVELGLDARLERRRHAPPRGGPGPAPRTRSPPGRRAHLPARATVPRRRASRPVPARRAPVRRPRRRPAPRTGSRPRTVGSTTSRYPPGTVTRTVAGRSPRPVGLEHLAEVEDVGLHAGDDPRRRGLAPHPVDQPLDGDRMAGLADEHREDRPLPATTQRQGLRRPGGLERPRRPNSSAP